MFPRHSRDLDRRLAIPFAFDVDEDVFEEIQVVDIGECFAFGFGLGEVGFGVRGCDDGEVTAETFFHFLVEVIAAMVRISGL